MLNFLIFVVSYFSGIILTFSSHTAWAFMLYQLVYFMNPLGRWWGHMLPELSYSFITVILMLTAYLTKFKKHNENKLFEAPQFKWIYIIAAGYLLANGYASLPSLNEAAATNYIKMAIIISIAYKLIDTNHKLNGVLLAYVTGAAYLGLIAYQVGRDSTGRVEGIGPVDSPDANGTAAAIAPAVVIALYFLWINTNKLFRISIAIAGAFIANAIVLINSRASFLAIIGGISYFLIYMILSKHQRPNQKKSAVAVIVFGLIGSILVIDQTAINRFLSIKEQEMTEEQQTGATRVYFWLAAMEMVQDHPYGTGAFGFEAHASDYLPRDMDTGFSRNRSVHSTWFEALTELGYIGLLVLVLMLKSCFWATRRSKRSLIRKDMVDEYFKVIAIEAALISFIIAMSFMNRFRAEIFYWCILFTACAYNIYVIKLNEPANDRLTNQALN